MADSKVTALNSLTPTVDDLLYVINDPAGTPGSFKAPISSVITLVSSGILPNGRASIAQGAVSAVITHGLNDSGANLIGTTPNWNAGGVYKTAQSATTITVAWPNECPLASGGELMWGVTT